MKCPKCNQILPDSMHCNYCDWKDEISIRGQYQVQSPVTKEILQSGIEQHTESDNQQEKSKPKNEPLPQDEHSEIKNDDKLIDIKKHDGIPNETPEELSQAEVEEGQPNDNKEIKDRGSNGTAKAAVTESKDEVAAKQGTELPVENR